MDRVRRRGPHGPPRKKATRKETGAEKPRGSRTPRAKVSPSQAAHQHERGGYLAIFSSCLESPSREPRLSCGPPSHACLQCRTTPSPFRHQHTSPVIHAFPRQAASALDAPLPPQAGPAAPENANLRNSISSPAGIYGYGVGGVAPFVKPGSPRPSRGRHWRASLRRAAGRSPRWVVYKRGAVASSSTRVWGTDVGRLRCVERERDSWI